MTTRQLFLPLSLFVAVGANCVDGDPALSDDPTSAELAPTAVDYPGAIPIFVDRSRVFQDAHPNDFIVIHATASPGESTAEAVAHYFQTTPLMSSTHYVVGRDGHVVQVVREYDGAGGNCCLEPGHDSIWPTNINLNTVTISIEFVNPTDDNSLAPTDIQKANGFALVADIARRHHIPDSHILGHNTIDPQSRARCPGNFPWNELWQYLHSSRVAMGRGHIANNADGRLELFARSSAGEAVHIWQTAPNGGWSSFGSFGGAPAREPAVGRNADGRLEALIIGADRNLYHRYQQINAGWTSSWGNMGEGFADSDPAVVSTAVGALDVYVKKLDGNIAHRWQAAVNGGWSNWAQLPPAAMQSKPVVARNADGRLEVFTVGPTGTLWHFWQVTPNGAWVSSWSDFGGVAIMGAPAVALNTNGMLEVFATGTDGQLWHRWESPGTGSGWSDWVSFHVVVKGDVAVGRNADGRLELFARTPNDTLFHIWQTAPHSSWSPGESFANTIVLSSPDVGANADGRLQVFYLSTNNALFSLWQRTGAPWSSPTSFGGSLASF